MEKLLRYLNPKSLNLEAMPSGGLPVITTADVCIAMSYARLTPMQDNLLRLKCLGANSIENIEKFSHVLVGKYHSHFIKMNLSSQYHFAVVKVALIEFCKVPADYKPTERNREVLSGFSDSTVRKHLKKHIDQVLEHLNSEYEIAEEKIFYQIFNSK